MAQLFGPHALRNNALACEALVLAVYSTRRWTPCFDLEDPAKASPRKLEVFRGGGRPAGTSPAPTLPCAPPIGEKWWKPMLEPTTGDQLPWSLTPDEGSLAALLPTSTRVDHSTTTGDIVSRVTCVPKPCHPTSTNS